MAKVIQSLGVISTSNVPYIGANPSTSMILIQLNFESLERMSLRGLPDILLILMLLTFAFFAGCVSTPKEPTQVSGAVPDEPPETKDNGPYTAAEVQQLEQMIWNRTNAERTKRGLNPLVWNNSLATVSDYHAWNMSNGGFRGHTAPDGDNPTQRIHKFKINCHNSVREIIAVGQVQDEEMITSLSKRIVASWMDSGPHRNEIISEDVEYAGVGVYADETGSIFTVQLFCEKINLEKTDTAYK